MLFKECLRMSHWLLRYSINYTYAFVLSYDRQIWSKRLNNISWIVRKRRGRYADHKSNYRWNCSRWRHIHPSATLSLGLSDNNYAYSTILTPSVDISFLSFAPTPLRQLTNTLGRTFYFVLTKSTWVFCVRNILLRWKQQRYPPKLSS